MTGFSFFVEYSIPLTHSAYEIEHVYIVKKTGLITISCITII